MPFDNKVHAAQTASRGVRKNRAPRRHSAGIVTKAPKYAPCTDGKKDASKPKRSYEDQMKYFQLQIDVTNESINETQNFIDKKQKGDDEPWDNFSRAAMVKFDTKSNIVSAETCSEYIRIEEAFIRAIESRIAKLIMQSRKLIRFVVKSRDTKRRKLNVFDNND